MVAGLWREGLWPEDGKTGSEELSSVPGPGARSSSMGVRPLIADASLHPPPPPPPRRSRQRPRPWLGAQPHPCPWGPPWPGPPAHHPEQHLSCPRASRFSALCSQGLAPPRAVAGPVAPQPEDLGAQREASQSDGGDMGMPCLTEAIGAVDAQGRSAR
ncbi:uncharacterized protein ACBT57_014890 [Dama dama]